MYLILRFSACALLLAPPVSAQVADVIRGRITGPTGMPIEGATVTATSTSGAVNRATRTGRDGTYSIVFPNGDGDYWISVAAIGYSGRRVQLKRLADEAALVADVRLAATGALLDPVNIRAPRQRVPVDTNGGSDIGGAEQRIATDALTIDQLSDLARIAGTIPGIQLIPGENGDPTGWTSFGLGPDQNQTTLNGLPFGGSALPRDAAFSGSVALSPYDVSRGGFSGGQLALRSRPPTNITLRANSFALDAPPMQWSDAAAEGLGQKFGQLSIGGVLTAPIRRDRAFAHVAYQGGRRFSDMRSILDADDATLRATGLASDSLARLLSILGGFQVPATLPSIPGQRLSEQGLLYGAIDFTSPSGSAQAINLVFTGSWNRQAPTGAGATSLPAQWGERTRWQGGFQARHTAYAASVLSETSFGVSGSGSWGNRYTDLPGGSVRIRSELEGESGVQVLRFGGNSALDRTNANATAAVVNHLSWYSLNNKHRLRLTTEVSRESIREELGFNTLGSFQFNSLADLEAGRPSSFTRQLTSRRHDLANYRLGLALGDVYSPASGLQVTFGARLDANRFSAKPQENPAINAAFGVRNDRAPNLLAISPRLGFSWTYGEATQLAAAEGATRAPRASLRGGIGVFQGTPATASLLPAIDATGLGSGSREIVCSGPAAPVPSWGSYSANPGTIPTACADGTANDPFANVTPGATLFARGFSSPRSVRSNVQWSGGILDGRFSARADATWSLNLSQPGMVDLNFRPDAQFTLPAEGDRPVFVPVAGIDPATGAIAPGGSRLSADFATVRELRSDLRSEARQLSLSVSPGGFRWLVDWSASYVHSTIRDQAYGFASAGRSPLERGWARSGFDSRHQLIYTLGYNLFDFARITWAGSFRSGVPFTPLIGGDVNGDGFSNDRAFIFSPDDDPDPEFATGLRDLMERGPRAARECLASQLGAIAERNSCTGPWTSAASLTIGLNPVRWWRSNRLDVLFNVANPLGAADLALHGANNLRGWGQTSLPQDVLYYVQGFDASTRRYRYEVNPRFGDASPARNTQRAPVILTAVVRVDIGPTRERQTLTQQLDRGRRVAGTKMSEAALRAAFASGGVFNPFAAVLRNADSIALTSPQADSLTRLNQQYVRHVSQIWAPIAGQLASLPDDYDEGEAYRLYLVGRRATIDLLSSIVDAAEELLSPEQRRRLPGAVLAHLDRRYLATIRSGTAGLGLAFLPGVSAPALGGGAVAIGR